jgi:hypothetical protein
MSVTKFTKSTFRLVAWVCNRYELNQTAPVSLPRTQHYVITSTEPQEQEHTTLGVIVTVHCLSSRATSTCRQKTTVISFTDMITAL